jgi:adenylate cyclase
LAVEADIDLTLLDFNMPVMDGLTLFARLREEQAPVKAIIVSAYGETPKLPDAAGGALPLLRPPVSNRQRNSRDCRAA